MRREERADYEWLFRASFRRIHRTVTLVLHDRDRAEEITQDAFLKLLENWRRVSGYEQPEAWVRRVAIRLAVRECGRERLRLGKERGALRAPVTEAETDPDLARAVATLAPRQRAAVVLHYYEDLPVLEVARVLNVSESTVKQHLMRARSRLAELLDEEVTDHVD
jgi:RNA polymerase sigma factor (sigma-70 family)